MGRGNLMTSPVEAYAKVKAEFGQVVRVAVQATAMMLVYLDVSYQKFEVRYGANFNRKYLLEAIVSN